MSNPKIRSGTVVECAVSRNKDLIDCVMTRGPRAPGVSPQALTRAAAASGSLCISSSRTGCGFGGWQRARGNPKPYGQTVMGGELTCTHHLAGGVYSERAELARVRARRVGPCTSDHVSSSTIKGGAWVDWIVPHMYWILLNYR